MAETPIPDPWASARRRDLLAEVGRAGVTETPLGIAGRMGRAKDSKLLQDLRDLARTGHVASVGDRWFPTSWLQRKDRHG